MEPLGGYEPVFFQIVCYIWPGGVRWSHWGELNPRPSPYQGDAIPLSHSGSGGAISGLDLTTADLAVKRGCRCNRLKSRISLVGLSAEIA